MNAMVRWTAGMQFRATTGSGTVATLDARPEHGGRDAGPSPMETVLLALGACTGMDVVSILQKMRAPLGGLEITITADRAEDHPRVFTRIALEYLFSGAGLRPEQVSRAVELSQSRYCSVSAMLRRVADLTYSWRIAEGPGGP
jgi:putative redox protein